MQSHYTPFISVFSDFLQRDMKAGKPTNQTTTNSDDVTLHQFQVAVYQSIGHQSI